MADSLLPYANPNNTYPKPATYLSGLTISGGATVDTLVATGAITVSGAPTFSGGITVTSGATIDSATVTGTATVSGALVVSGGMRVNTRSFTSGATVSATASDFLLEINKGTGSATAVVLVSGMVNGARLIVKDGKGDAGSNNITVSGNGFNIDGAATKVISANYGSLDLVSDGAQILSI